MRGKANEPVRKPLAQAVFAFVRRQDGGSPCGGRLGEATLPDGRSKLRPSRCGGYARGELSQRL